MDDVPCAFVECVLTRLDIEDVDKIRLLNINAPRWTKTAQTHLQKQKSLFSVSVRFTENGKLFFFYSHAASPGANLKKFTFEEAIRLDLRFVRIVQIFIISLPQDDNAKFEVPMERLSDVVRFLSQCRVEVAFVSVKCPSFIKRLAEELALNSISAKKLILDYSPGMEDVMKSQLAGEDVLELKLRESWSQAIQTIMESVLGSANLKKLRIVGETPKLDCPALTRTIAVWKETPDRKVLQLLRPRAEI